MKPCSVCRKDAEFSFSVDFNKSCEEGRGKFLPLSGKKVDYYRCGACGHLFAPEFLEWGTSAFEEHIYNEDYVKVDPDYVSERFKKNTEKLSKMFMIPPSSHLDYGSGNGGLVTQLRTTLGWNSQGYEPNGETVCVPFLQKYKLITAFEVFEHVPDPHQIMRDLEPYISDSTVLLFSTSLSDHIVTDKRTGAYWWYVAPRNGHVSIFSFDSLCKLLQEYGLSLMILPSGGFAAFKKNLPPWFCDSLSL